MAEQIYPLDRAIKADGVKGYSCPRLRCEELETFQKGELVPVEYMVSGQAIKGLNVWARLSPLPLTDECIYVHSLDIDWEASVFLGRVKSPTSMFAAADVLSERRRDLVEGDILQVIGDEEGQEIDRIKKWYQVIHNGRKGYVHSLNVERTS